MTVDLIVCWPRPCDYPAFRAWVTGNRWRFAKVIVVFTELAGRDISGFVRSQLDATFLDGPSEGDWRDAAVNAALDASTARTVLFMEQDFVIEGPMIAGTIHDHWPTMLGWDAGDGRPFHPSFLLVRRSLVDQTSRYFGPDPVDHFCAFGRELCAITYPVYLPDSGFRHYQAISESQMLLGLGERPKFRPEQFREWLGEQLSAGVPLEPGWEALMREELAR